ncbi:hypothetical protein [Rubrobacter marinus]|uniref:hypothetical protein n=1 Tax=Rubrobacter marinus TaxID=2653852 RepID=UPI00140AC480|nr:hypothetical protein [Rubrobacter marinus]
MPNGGAARGKPPRVLVPVPSGALLSPEDLAAAGVEPIVFGPPVELPGGGVALRREWVADWAELFCAGNAIDAVVLGAEEPGILAGLLVAALRLDLPAVALPALSPFSVALAAMGVAPLRAGAVETVARVAEAGLPRSGALVSTFSLANALRAGLSAGAGPELIVHLAAVAREARVSGFSPMVRVLAPRAPPSPTRAGSGSTAPPACSPPWGTPSTTRRRWRGL